MNSSELPINVCEVGTPEGLKYYVCISSKEAVFDRGLVPEEIVGVLLRPLKKGESITPDNFVRNSVFVEFLHRFIGECGSTLSTLAATATRQGEGWVYVLDGRTPDPQGAVPPEDIIGAFQVKGGQIVPASYQRNANHRVLSQRGFVRLESELLARFLSSLSQYAQQGAQNRRAEDGARLS